MQLAVVVIENVPWITIEPDEPEDWDWDPYSVEPEPEPTIIDTILEVVRSCWEDW